MKISLHLRSGLLALSLAAVVLIPHVSAKAALMAYDGFISGGATPNTAAGEYETTTGFANDELIGQNPTTTGFDSTAWTNSSSSYAAHIYYKTDDDQLTYVDSTFRQLNTSFGQLDLTRNSGTGGDVKQVFRDLDIGNALPDTLYISVLVQLSPSAEFMLRSASTDGSSIRRFNFGIDAVGNPFATGSGTGGFTDTNTGITVATDQPHLLVAKLTNDGFESDQIDLYLDPDLQSEGLNTPVATVDGGNFYVGGNGSWTLKDIFFFNNPSDDGEYVIMDEVRVGEFWSDVTPFTIVPEPATAALMLVPMASLMLRRRRA
ncbi:PEP-CTERM sorting domain-containing protein [Planctomycetales bacterium ZRK34]|nr:PEP-CTERM sorting domain-containing protein [Planctomycetales bacterium ZRK34]